MRFLAFAGLAVSLPLLAGPAFQIPAQTKQGNVVRIEVSGLSNPDGLTATMEERTIRLFPAGQQDWLGLMPVPATLKPGSYPVSVRDNAGRILYSSQVKVSDARFRVQNIVATKAMKSLTPLPDEVETIRAFNQTISDTAKAEIFADINFRIGMSYAINRQEIIDTVLSEVQAFAGMQSFADDVSLVVMKVEADRQGP